MMNEEKTFTLEEAQQLFARGINSSVWQLLEKADRSEDENELIVHAAHASCYHWLQVGTAVNQQRGEWLISRVYAELGRADAAVRHARRCLALTNEFSEQMKDFDRAYGYECVARASAVAGEGEEASQYLRLAEEAAERIAGEEDKKIFDGDFGSGNWHGLK